MDRGVSRVILGADAVPERYVGERDPRARRIDVDA